MLTEFGFNKETPSIATPILLLTEIPLLTKFEAEGTVECWLTLQRIASTVVCVVGDWFTEFGETIGLKFVSKSIFDSTTAAGVAKHLEGKPLDRTLIFNFFLIFFNF